MQFKLMLRKSKYLFIVLSTSFLLSNCNRHVTQDDINKIQFDYSKIDNTGLRHEGVSVDYEFCIPAKKSNGKKILGIEPETQIFSKSKGRSGCSDSEWLCIISNHDNAWKEKLFAIASLPFVERIRQTDYE
jgi:hypothetical protein